MGRAVPGKKGLSPDGETAAEPDKKPVQQSPLPVLQTFLNSSSLLENISHLLSLSNRSFCTSLIWLLPTLLTPAIVA